LTPCVLQYTFLPSGALANGQRCGRRGVRHDRPAHGHEVEGRRWKRRKRVECPTVRRERNRRAQAAAARERGAFLFASGVPAAGSAEGASCVAKAPREWAPPGDEAWLLTSSHFKRGLQISPQHPAVRDRAQTAGPLAAGACFTGGRSLPDRQGAAALGSRQRACSGLRPADCGGARPPSDAGPLFFRGRAAVRAAATSRFSVLLPSDTNHPSQLCVGKGVARCGGGSWWETGR
jgi:hypothetical protein